MKKQEPLKKQDLLKKYKKERSKVLEYTRVMGYMRPTESFNIGKKGEFSERVYFTGCCRG